MSDSNQHSHPNKVQMGPATLCLYDEVNDHLVGVGKVDDLVLVKEVDDVVLTEFISSVETEIDCRPIAERYKLRGIFRETLDPNIQRLFFKNCGTPAITGSCSIGTITERRKVYDGYQKMLKYNNSFYGEGALPGPANVTSTEVAGAGALPAGTYVIVVTCMYGNTESDFEEAAGKAVGLNDALTVVITPPAGGYVPDSYKIYVYDTAIGETRLADADLILETDTTGLYFTSWVRGDNYPGDQTSSFSVTDLLGNPLVAGVDYTIDSTCGMFCVVSGGSIGDGEDILITYSYYKNPKSALSLGPPDRLPKYVHPVLMSFKDDDRTTPIGRGLEIHLYRVVANSGWEWELSKMEWNTGFNFEWKVLSDPRKLKHADVYTYHRQLSNYTLLDLAALTEFSNAVACAP